MTVINNADAVYLGGTAVDRVYLGSERVWPAFLPVDLFANSEQGAWYNPGDLSSLFQDSAGTVPVTADGDPVGLMLEKSGNINNGTQSISSQRPIYTSASGLDFLFFDELGGYLLIPYMSGDFNNFVFSVAVNIETAADNNPRYFGLEAAGINLQCGYANDGTIFTRVDNTTHATSSKISIGSTYVISHIRQAGVSSIRIDGTDFSLGGSGPSANSEFTNTAVIGAGYEPGSFKMKGKMYGAIFRYGSITETQLSGIDTYLAAISGVTL
jgi:hypothetical protein